MKLVSIDSQFRFTKLGSVWNFKWDDSHASDFEAHLLCEIIYVVSGCVRVTEDTRLYDLCEGDMIIHAPMELHAIKSAYDTSPNVYIVSVFADGKLPENLMEGVFSLSENERVEFKELFNRLHEFYHKDNTNNLLGQECADALSSFIVRMGLRHKTENKFVFSRSAEEYNKIISSMAEHIYDNCTLEEIALDNNISVSNMKILFRKYNGLSPKMYYMRLRCNEAIRLMSSGLSTIETADKLNFSSPGYFNKFFKRITGIPPATFIKKAQNKR